MNVNKGSEATLLNAYDGKKSFVEIHVRKYLTSDLPRDSEDEISKFLMQLYQEKDQIKDYYLKHGHFETQPGYKTFKEKHFVIINLKYVFSSRMSEMHTVKETFLNSSSRFIISYSKFHIKMRNISIEPAREF